VQWFGYVRMDDGSSLRVTLPKSPSLLGAAAATGDDDEVKAVMTITEFIAAATSTRVGSSRDPVELLGGGTTCWATRLRSGLTAHDTRGRPAMAASFYLVIRGDSLFGIIKSGEMLASCYLQLVRKPDACKLGLNEDT
jgi:hypothetical protein